MSPARFLQMPPAMSSITRVFLSYAAKDANDRSLLIAATKAARLPVQFVEMPNHVTDGRSRRVLCRAKLQQCDVALVLASPHAVDSSIVDADLECVHEMELPVHAIVPSSVRGDFVPPLDWRTSSVVNWSWSRIAALLQRPFEHVPHVLAAS
jgi:hypothetical protein